jgi:L-threonylcarbamoyladenylate synthase
MRQSIRGNYATLSPMVLVTLDEAIQRLLDGEIGILPTDTIYGVISLASSEQAVARLYAAKHREHKPGTVIAANTQQLVDLGLKRRYLQAVEQYWPGPVSVVIPCSDTLGYLRQDVQGLAVRVPSDPAIHALLEQTGPLLTSSANQPSEPPATKLGEAEAYFGDSVDFYVDGGDTSGRPPSTVIRIVDDAIEVLRQGAVHIDER